MSSIDLTEKDAVKIFSKAKRYGARCGAKIGLMLYPFATAFVIANLYVHDTTYYARLMSSPLFWVAVLLVIPGPVMILFGCIGQFWYVWKTMRSLQFALAGRCMQCGYDLRGVKDRCPECNAEQTVLMRRLDHLR